MLELMEQIKCAICQKPFETEKARISHDNKLHGGLGTRALKLKFCNGCQAYKNKEEDFYKLNDGYYSQCKECSSENKETWINTTTRGYAYKRHSQTSKTRYVALCRKAAKAQFLVSLTLDEYMRVLEEGNCMVCGGKFKGVMDVETLQPKVGLVYGNCLFQCMICATKRKYNIK